MRLLWVALAAVLLGGCVVVPAAPYASPGPGVGVGVGVGAPVHRGGYYDGRPHYHGHRHDGYGRGYPYYRGW